MRQAILLYLFFLLATWSVKGYAEDHKSIKNTIHSDNCEKKENLSTLPDSQKVYICTDSYARTYHRRSNCKGLSNCKDEIQTTDVNIAIDSLGRVPCCRCWSNVKGHCKDDNPNYGISAGGGAVFESANSDAAAFAAIGIALASVAIFSNDFYLSPTYSFYKDVYNTKNPSRISNVTNNLGWVFGFRRTFKHSALEYGGSYLQEEYEIKDSAGNLMPEKMSRWGAHINYVSQVLYNQTPKGIKIYLGPSINYIYNVGFGGLVGTEIRLFDRLKLDLRYELTTQTNQVQAGLIFTYQKKFPWQKE